MRLLLNTKQTCSFHVTKEQMSFLTLLLKKLFFNVFGFLLSVVSLSLALGSSNKTKIWNGA